MNAFDWSKAAELLSGFGGEPITLHVPKTGLPFFDTLRLYGAMDLYVGIREDVSIHDSGTCWKIQGRSRKHLLQGKDIAAFKQAWAKKKPLAKDYCQQFHSSLVNDTVFEDKYSAPANRAFVGLDASLQAGIRGVSAASYETLQSGETRKSACLANIPLSQGLLAFAGKNRTESAGNILFLPIFEGPIDLSKVISPLRAWLKTPNVLCAQALMLLALKASLFAEGYQDRLTAVVYNTNFAPREGFNYSGLLDIASTAIGKMKSSALVSHGYQVFRRIVREAWPPQRQATEWANDALVMAYWLMQPVSKHLTSMITSQERLRIRGYQPLFTKPEYVKEVFQMSYGNWQGNHEALQKLAKAVASSIYHARMKGADDPRKNWYDEVVMLRSAPSAKAFIERAMILIEQGHREHGQVGTVHRGEAFDPSAVFASLGKDRSDFETFRDLFRMYLVQESTYKAEGETAPVAEEELEVSEEETIEGGTE